MGRGGQQARGSGGRIPGTAPGPLSRHGGAGLTAPRAAMRSIAAVAGPHLHLVFHSLVQPGQGQGVGGGIGVALRFIPRGEVLVRPGPVDPVVGGLLAGRVPGDFQFTGTAAAQRQSANVAIGFRRGVRGGLRRGFRRRVRGGLRRGRRGGAGLTAPRAAVRSIAAVAGPHLHLVFHSLVQPGQGQGVGGGIGVALRFIPRGEVLVRPGPVDPVVGGLLAGRVPGDFQFTGTAAAQRQSGYCLAALILGRGRRPR